MNYLEKIVISILLLSVSSLNANSFNNFSPITWNWIAIIVLTILFFMLFLSIIKDIKKTKKHINNIFKKQKCENLSNSSYLNDINNNRLLATNSLKESIDGLSNLSDKSILDNLSKVYRDIFLTNREESIFLSIAKGKKIGKTDSFRLKELLNELHEYNIIDSSFRIEDYIIVGNKEVISDIFLLLNKLQTKEHNLKKPNFNIDIDSKKGNLKISIDKKLKLNKTIDKLLKQNIKPIYSSKDNKYYGIYLYLLKHLTNMINATLKINLNDNSYLVSIDIPIDVKRESKNSDNTPNLVLKDRKKALIISQLDSSKEIAKRLEEFNISADIKAIKEINKELPNFIEYDIAFIYSKIFEPILTDYLRAIKTYSKLKIVSMVDSKNSLYPTKIVDSVLDLDSIDSRLYSSVLDLYKEEMVTPMDNIDTMQEPKKKNIQKYGKVLIADDDIANLHILDYMFKEYGIKTTTVTNGLDALDRLNREDFDLVILDSVMPKLDGYQTITKIREDNRFNSTPIVIHTSFSIEESSMDKIFKLGFDSYLPKPFNKYDFKSIIERYIPAYIEPEAKKEPQEKKNINKLDTESLKEFIAIYGDSDKMLTRYIKEKRDIQAFSLIDDLKDLAQKIDAKNFISLLNEIEENLKRKKEVDSNLIYELSNNLNELKKDIMKRLSA